MSESERPIRLHVYLPPRDAEDLRRLAKEEDRSMSSVVRRAVQDRLVRQEAAA